MFTQCFLILINLTNYCYSKNSICFLSSLRFKSIFQNHNMDGRRADDVPSLAEELLETDGCWGEKSFSLGMWSLGVYSEDLYVHVYRSINKWAQWAFIKGMHDVQRRKWWETLGEELKEREWGVGLIKMYYIHVWHSQTTR